MVHLGRKRIKGRESEAKGREEFPGKEKRQEGGDKEKKKGRQSERQVKGAEGGNGEEKWGILKPRKKGIGR